MVAERVAPRPRPDLGPVCRHGHKRTFKNLYRHPNGHMRCLPCLRETRNRWGRANPRPNKGLGHGWSAGKKECVNGHPYTPENTYRDPKGYRRCQECRRENSREYGRRRTAKLRKEREMALGTSSMPVARPEPSQAPLTGFDAVVAAQVAQVREIAARGETRFSDLVNAGLVAARERQRAARGPIRGRPTPEQIRAATADAFGLDVADLTGPSREYDVSHPRQAAYYLIRQECGDVTFDAIGALFGGRDHATICYGHDKIARLVAAGDKATLRLLDEIKGALA